MLRYSRAMMTRKETPIHKVTKKAMVKWKEMTL